ncbi:hypothetical protein AcW2_005695 [Taiwanofungus camphoratus]|nr:hypothetical protein AcW2_005695 [Antrodia cinnamomea]
MSFNARLNDAFPKRRVPSSGARSASAPRVTASTEDTQPNETIQKRRSNNPPMVRSSAPLPRRSAHRGGFANGQRGRFGQSRAHSREAPARVGYENRAVFRPASRQAPHPPGVAPRRIGVSPAVATGAHIPGDVSSGPAFSEAESRSSQNVDFHRPTLDTGPSAFTTRLPTVGQTTALVSKASEKLSGTSTSAKPPSDCPSTPLSLPRRLPGSASGPANTNDTSSGWMQGLANAINNSSRPISESSGPSNGMRPPKRRKLSATNCNATQLSSATDTASIIPRTELAVPTARSSSDPVPLSRQAPTTTTEAASHQQNVLPVKRERSPTPPITVGPRPVKEGSLRFTPLPANCRASHPQFQQNRKEWIAREIAKLRQLGLKVARVFTREDGMVIDWTSSTPVMSDTLRPASKESGHSVQSLSAARPAVTEILDAGDPSVQRRSASERRQRRVANSATARGVVIDVDELDSVLVPASSTTDHAPVPAERPATPLRSTGDVAPTISADPEGLNHSTATVDPPESGSFQGVSQVDNPHPHPAPHRPALPLPRRSTERSPINSGSSQNGRPITTCEMDAGTARETLDAGAKSKKGKRKSADCGVAQTISGSTGRTPHDVSQTSISATAMTDTSMELEPDLTLSPTQPLPNTVAGLAPDGNDGQRAVTKNMQAVSAFELLVHKTDVRNRVPDFTQRLKEQQICSLSKRPSHEIAVSRKGMPNGFKIVNADVRALPTTSQTRSRVEDLHSDNQDPREVISSVSHISSEAEREEMETAALEYLRKYFQTFDSDRSALASAYCRAATFSIQNWDWPSTPAMLGRCSPVTSLKQGRLKIMASLLSLHDDQKFCKEGGTTVEYDTIYLGNTVGVLLICYTHHSEVTTEKNESKVGEWACDQRFLLRSKEWDEEDRLSEGLWPFIAVSHQMTIRSLH